MAWRAQVGLLLLAACLCAAGQQRECIEMAGGARDGASERNGVPSFYFPAFGTACVSQKTPAMSMSMLGTRDRASDSWPAAAAVAAVAAAARQSSWDYSSLLAPQRFAGIAFDGEAADL